MEDNQNFEGIFGRFNGVAAEGQYRPTTTVTIDDGTANPCNKCGHYPRIHDTFFRDPNKPHFYIDCECCGDTDGKWYSSPEEAVAEWNKLNPLKSVKKDSNLKKRNDFIKDIALNSKIES